MQSSSTRRRARYQARQARAVAAADGAPRPAGERRRDRVRPAAAPTAPPRASGRRRDAAAAVHKYAQPAQTGPRNQPRRDAQVQALTRRRPPPSAVDRHEPRRLADSGSRSRLRDVPDFPEPGRPLQGHHAAARRRRRRSRGRRATSPTRHAGQVDVVVGIEARGFILGAAGGLRARHRLRAGAQGRQAAGRDPGESTTTSSTAPPRSRCTPTPSRPGERVLVVDDVLATGGTAAATCELLERAGAKVVAFEVRGRARPSSAAASVSRTGRPRPVGAPRRHLSGATVTDVAPRHHDCHERGPLRTAGAVLAPSPRPRARRLARGSGGDPRARRQPGARAAAAGGARQPPQGRPVASSSGPTPSPSGPTRARCARAATPTSPTRSP